MPIILRNTPDPKYNAKASKSPIPTANNRAVETEDSCFLSDDRETTFLIVQPSKESAYMKNQFGVRCQHISLITNSL